MIVDNDTQVAPSGMCYHKDCPPALVTLLEYHRVKGTRLLFTFGNVETGEVWESLTPERGRIGRSTGPRPIPLLVRTSRSFGGEALMSHCILRIVESRGGKLVYSKPFPNLAT